MKTEERAVHPAISTWHEAIGLLRSKPILFFPLGVSAAIKFLLLLITLVAPFQPFSRVVAPVVRYFWGEIHLHYPYHLALAGRLFRRSDILFPILLEGFLVGVTSFLCRQFLSGQPPKASQAFSGAFQRYPAMLLISMVSALALIVSFQGVMIPIKLGFRWLPEAWARSGLVVVFSMGFISVFLASVLETVFIFSVPICVLERRSWFRAIGRSWQIGLRGFRPIFLGLWAMSLAYLPFILLRQAAGPLVTSAWPESLLLVYTARILAAWGISTLFSVWAAVYLIRHVERAGL